MENENQELAYDIDFIKEKISAHAHELHRYARQRDYAGGNHGAILMRPAHEEPDNRIPIPIARKAIRFVTGYMFKPGNVTYSCDNPKNYIADILKPIFDLNDEELTTQNEAETALTHGEAWEYHYTKNGKPRFVEVPIDQCIPIYDDGLPPELVGFIRYYRKHDGYVALYYDAFKIYRFEGADVSSIKYISEESHGYKMVPWADFPMSRDRSNLFDAVIPIIDSLDRVVSEDFANELQRFANAFLLLGNRLDPAPDENGQTEIDKLKITKTFEDLLGGGDGGSVTDKVNFLVKNINDTFIGNAADRFERLVYEMMMVINPDSDKFAASESGVAMAYKLIQFEYLCASIEAWFSRGLQRRILLVQSLSNNMSAETIDVSRLPQVTISFRRNLPYDLTSSVEQFVKLYGILPNDIALKVFPASFIPDMDAVIKEMENKEEERAVNAIELAQQTAANEEDTEE